MNRNNLIRKVLAKVIPDKKHIFYHGSNLDFDKFEENKQKSGFYPGVYTSTDLNRAKEHGKIIYKIEVAGKFYEFDSNSEEDIMLLDSGSRGSGSNLAKRLKAAGYLGIKRGTEYVIFEASQIKILDKIK